MLHAISARCVARHLYMIVTWPFECTCWRQFKAQWEDCRKSRFVPFKSIIISRSLSIYLVLFVLQVAHKASTRARQWCRSAETRSRRPHVQPFSFISLSTVLLQVSLGRPLFLWPSGVHRRAILVKAVVCWRSTCPIHRQRLRLTWVEMGSISALRCSSSLVMVFGQ